MKKILIFTVIQILLFSCKAVSQNSSKPEKFNIESFRNLSLDERYPQSPNDVFYKNKEESIRVTTSKTNIQVEKNVNDSPYKFVEIYSIKDSLLVREGKSFYYFPIGVWKEYDTSGMLIRSINYDEDFGFSIDSLIEKMNKEFKIGILEKDRTLCYRYYNKDMDKSFYEVCHKITTEGEQLDCFLFDGDSGNLLFKTTQYQQNKNGSLYEQYLKALEK